ncbi:MAG TPA: alkaline phosphatase family protein [Bacteriovoracaceae bacterium]|nr:alkaline phosphatase family protein [Bacteriovoracaceae bacterium]
MLISTPLHAKNVIFWLSVDGFKPSYLDHSNTPHLRKMISHSVYTRKLAPIFPSITFPSHSSQATGVKVKEHGIPFNTFYDSATGKTESYPNESSLLQAEPIWQTTKRGGLRSAVLNWPLSFKQEGEFKSDIFNPTYENELSDEERIDRSMEIWQKELDAGRELDLIMAYIVGPDSVGHQFGPQDEKVFKVVENVDLLIGKLQAKIRQIADSRKKRDDKYFLLITTDHGMTAVKTAVNLTLLSNLSSEPRVKLITGGNVGHVFLDKIPEGERSSLIKRLMTEYKKYPYVTAYEKNKMPAEWNYGHSTRVGDLVVILDGGYAFVNNVPKVSVPIGEIGGPLGMHGYHPRMVSDMYGLMVMWQYPEIPQAKELKSPIDSLQLHPTVAFLLGISPSAKAIEKPIKEVTNLN